jgi:addiction module RelE/StbE family toxin
MNVHWTDTAQRHLDAIYRYIAQDSPAYAERTVDRLTRRSQQIAEFPLSGRMVPEYEKSQIREVIEGPYRIIYYIKPDQIDVLAVIHGAQDTLRQR